MSGVTVLYIGGEGRSGSTVLSSILGSHDDMVATGEVRTVWRAVKTNELCGCGVHVLSCEFWRAVGECAFGGWGAIDIESMLSADRRLARHRAVIRRIVLGSRRETSELQVYLQTLGRLYGAIHEVSGSRVIVDSTKDPSYAYLLREVPGIDLRVVHLVRDSRGVAYSKSKEHIVRPEFSPDSNSGDVYMPDQAVWRTAIEWDVKNLLFYAFVKASKRRFVRYESLVDHTSDELAAIREFASVDRHDDGSWDEASRSFEALPHHTLEGNPARFARGRVRLTYDEDWKRKMTLGQRSVVSVLTLPLLVAYGYPTIAAWRKDRVS